MTKGPGGCPFEDLNETMTVGGPNIDAGTTISGIEV